MVAPGEDSAALSVSSSTREVSELGELPIELLLAIAYFVDPSDVASLHMTSRGFLYKLRHLQWAESWIDDTWQLNEREEQPRVTETERVRMLAASPRLNETIQGVRFKVSADTQSWDAVQSLARRLPHLSKWSASWMDEHDTYTFVAGAPEADSVRAAFGLPSDQRPAGRDITLTMFSTYGIPAGHKAMQAFKPMLSQTTHMTTEINLTRKSTASDCDHSHETLDAARSTTSAAAVSLDPLEGQWSAEYTIDKRSIGLLLDEAPHLEYLQVYLDFGDKPGTERRLRTRADILETLQRWQGYE